MKYGCMDNCRCIELGLGRYVDVCVRWGLSERVVFALLLSMCAVTNSGGCRHTVNYCVVWPSCSNFYAIITGSEQRVCAICIYWRLIPEVRTKSMSGCRFSDVADRRNLRCCVRICIREINQFHSPPFLPIMLQFWDVARCAKWTHWCIIFMEGPRREPRVVEKKEVTKWENWTWI
jgi:hypothetical protein